MYSKDQHALEIATPIGAKIAVLRGLAYPDLGLTKPNHKRLNPCWFTIAPTASGYVMFSVLGSTRSAIPVTAIAVSLEIVI